MVGMSHLLPGTLHESGCVVRAVARRRAPRGAHRREVWCCRSITAHKTLAWSVGWYLVGLAIPMGSSAVALAANIALAGRTNVSRRPTRQHESLSAQRESEQDLPSQQ